MDAQVAERMAAELFGNDLTENSIRSSQKASFLKLKESIVVNGNYYIPAGTELRFITP